MQSLSFALYFIAGCLWLLMSFAHFERSRKTGRVWNLVLAFAWLFVAVCYWAIGTQGISG